SWIQLNILQRIPKFKYQDYITMKPVLLISSSSTDLCGRKRPHFQQHGTREASQKPFCRTSSGKKTKKNGAYFNEFREKRTLCTCSEI
ncbi:hypothetical protein CEXT_536861, partial [Caerostris extrusa]